MSSEPRAFARAVLDAFRTAGLYTDQEVGDAGGPSTTTLTRLRKVADGNGTMPEPRGDTYKRIDTAARWPNGSARDLWREGKQPPPSVSHVQDWARSRTQQIVVADQENLSKRVSELEALVLELLERLAAAGADDAGGRPDFVVTRQGKGIRVEFKDVSTSLSPAPDRPDLAIAADEQESSIAGEQEQPTEP